MTVEQNLYIPTKGLNISKNQKTSRMKQVLEQFGISHIMRESICNVSSFDKQMVALARAVINNPLMIIADEPTDNLSINEEQKFIEHLQELYHEGITIMLISEKKEFENINHSRHIYFKNGRVSEDTMNPMKEL